MQQTAAHNQMSSETNAGTRLDVIDALRAIAILLVLGRHAPAVPAGAAPDWVVTFLIVLKQGGWIGVDLFFVLSGFLVAGLLFREYQSSGELCIGRFLTRRAFKIYPAFYVMFAVTLLVAGSLGLPLPRADVLLSEALFVQNYGSALFPHTWSLAVEEHFYLLLPFALLLLRNCKGAPFARIPLACGLVMVLCLTGRIFTAETLSFTYKTHLFATHLRLDSLFFGVFLAWCFHFHANSLRAFTLRWRPFLLIGAIALAAPAFYFKLGAAPMLTTFGLTAITLAAGSLLIVSLTWKSGPTTLVRIGSFSYSIYLWHMTLLLFGVARLPTTVDPFSRLLIFGVGSIGFGILMARLIETPFLAIRDRYFPSSARQHPPAAATAELFPLSAAESDGKRQT